MGFPSLLCCGRGSDRKERGKQPTWRIFSLKELHAATNNFNYDNKLGEGSFGSVYWGQLWDGSQIAVKRLKVWSNKAEMEFSVEVEILARVRHRNLISLRGFCAEGQERLLVYEYMPNLSLLSHLHGQHSAECLLDWNRRMKIAIGTADGIAYLHHQATPHIVHADIRASNVLLDSEYDAQVADFGFAKIIPDDETETTKKFKSTHGYLPLEYETLSKAKESCDVYSFGILLLELASGRKPIERLKGTTKRVIIDWAFPLACERNFAEMADPRLNGKFVEEELRRVVLVGLLCSHSQPEKRPTMLEVLELLRGESKQKLAEIENEVLSKGPKPVAHISVVESDSDIISEAKQESKITTEPENA